MTVTGIIDHGTIVSVVLDDHHFIHFDHRQFQLLVDNEGDIIGREAEENDEGNFEFLD